MKKCKAFTVLMLAMLLSGCNAGGNAETASETVSEQSTVSETVQSEEISTTASEQITASETVQSETSKTVAEQTTIAAETEKTTEKTTIETDEELIETSAELETELENEGDGANIYHDTKTNEYFIMLNVTPQKIYWNEMDGYDVAEGQAMDIAVPAVFEDWLADADGVMLYLSEYERTFGDIKIDDQKIKGMTYPQYWCRDYLCTIKDGTVRFDNYTDEIGNHFSGFSDGNNIEWGNIQYPENQFENGMTVEKLDLYFETVKADYEELEALIAANPNSEFEISPLFTEQGSGIRFRATINYIY